MGISKADFLSLTYDQLEIMADNYKEDYLNDLRMRRHFLAVHMNSQGTLKKPIKGKEIIRLEGDLLSLEQLKILNAGNG